MIHCSQLLCRRICVLGQYAPPRSGLSLLEKFAMHSAEHEMREEFVAEGVTSGVLWSSSSAPPGGLIPCGGCRCRRQCMISLPRGVYVLTEGSIVSALQLAQLCMKGVHLRQDALHQLQSMYACVDQATGLRSAIASTSSRRSPTKRVGRKCGDPARS